MLDELLLLLRNLGQIVSFLTDSEASRGQGILRLQLDNYWDTVIWFALLGDADYPSIDGSAVPTAGIGGLTTQCHGYECRDNNRGNNWYGMG